MDSRVVTAALRLLSRNLSESPDNPLQMDRLPDDAEVQLDYPVYQQNRQTAMRNVGLLLLLSSLVAPLLAWFGNLVPIPYLAGGLYTASILFAGIMLALGVFGRWWPVGAYVIAGALVPVLILLARDVPLGISALVLGAGGLGVLATSLGTNYVYMRSAAPMPSATAQRIRLLWDRRYLNIVRPMRGGELHIIDFLLLPCVVVFLFMYITTTNGRSSLTSATSVMVAIGLMGVFASSASEHFLAALYGRRSHSLKARWNAFFNALLEWANYNRLNTRGVGVHRSPVGNCASRRRLLMGVVAAWACLWAGFQITPPKSDDVPAAVLDYAEAILEREASRIKHVPEYNAPRYEPPPLGTEEQEFVNRLPAEARERYLAQRNEEFLESAGERVQDLREGPLQSRPADQLIHFLEQVGSVTFQAIVPCLATLAAVFGLLFGMTSRSLAGVEAALPRDHRRRVLSTDNWETLVERVQSSSDKQESECVLVGANARDDTPILVPRKVFQEHAHVLGDTGAGKTTMGLMPLIAQLMRFGDSSVVVIDLKADKQFFFESLKEEAARVPEWVQNVPNDKERVKCAEYPFRWFTTLLGRSSYAFNPLAQRVMPKLTPDQRTDILTAAMGLQYGTDYGRKYFGDANYEVLNYALRENPNVGSLSELERILAGANRFPLPDETRRAGTHVLSSVRRLARLKALNACPAIGTPQSVLDAAIDLDDVFSQPQVLYFALPASSGVSNTAELARIVLYSLLAAAQAHEGRRTQVYLVVDEFQRIVSNNVELFLQQARSMNIGCVLANQSLGDLLRVDADLVSAVRTNTRFRQIFGAGSSEDIRDIVETSGEMVQGMRTWNYATGLFQTALRGFSIGESVRPRLSVNDILKATDAPGRSITTIRRGESYAQYGGFPFIMDSVHHISPEEFQRREDEKWPAQTPKTVIATLDDYATPLPNPAQILGGDKPSASSPSVPSNVSTTNGSTTASATTDDAGRIDAATSDGVTMSFLDAMYQEQQEKARAHLAKRKKKTRRNFPTDS